MVIMMMVMLFLPFAIHVEVHTFFVGENPLVAQLLNQALDQMTI